jgi:acyl-coenzyme A synthetase/AMP-(fatty) acid ligase
MSLRELIAASRPSPCASLRAAGATVSYDEILRGAIFSGHRRELEGKSVLVAAASQLASALALIELDGVASRLVICPPDFTGERLVSVIAQAEVDVILCDDPTKDFGADVPRYPCGPLVDGRARESSPQRHTEWVLPTSGATGAPKLVAHRLEALLGAIGPAPRDIVWATFYDIRRYGGLQIFLRAATSGATMVLSDPREALADHLARCREAGVTHMSGTPSHWRKLLMSPHVAMLAPEYVRLSGEIADRAVLDALRAAYPNARVVHAYASTEAGVGFEVSDGREGFPASFVGGRAGVDMRVTDGSLRIRSNRTATRYIGRDDLRLADDEGFVDTDDVVELRGDRYFFKGRRAGVINVGGLKVHPEEVEQVINSHGGVRMSLVRARRNPIMGDIIVADVVLKSGAEQVAALESEILSMCRERLERHKVPAIIEFVPSLDMIASGKLARRHA